MFYEKILSLKNFLASNSIIFCYWYENLFFSFQIIYFLACNKDTILALNTITALKTVSSMN